MIVCVIAPKPKIIIFDEATSTLDNKTQKQVSEALDKMELYVNNYCTQTIKNSSL